MLRALSEYHKYLCRQESSPLSPKGFSKVAVNFNMILTSDGKLKDIIPYTQKSIDGKKDISIIELFPFRKNITTIESQIIEPKGMYNFGMKWDSKLRKFYFDKTGSAKKAFEKNKNINLEFLEDLTSPVIDAYKCFLNNWIPEKQLENPILLKLSNRYSDASFVVSVEYHNEFLHNDAKVKDKWESMFEKSQNDIFGESVRCIISGKEISKSQITDKHDKINVGEHLVPLISFKNSAYWSYNKEKNDNAYISKQVMGEYTQALKFLFKSEKHRYILGDLTLYFWAMTDKDETPFLEAYCCGLNGSTNDSVNSDELNEILSSVFKDLANGRKADFENLNIDENVEFYIIGAKGYKGRFSLKFFEHNTFGNMMKNLALHHEDFKMSDDDKAMALWQIQKELKSPVGNTAVNPDLSVKMLQSILTNIPYPRYLMDNIIHRVKTDKDNPRFIAINKNRVRIIRACLIRFNKIERGAYKMFNKDSTEVAYNLGGIFAILERIQERAISGENKKLNATIKDKFFSSACSSPTLVFPRILMLAQNHISKIKKDGKYTYEIELGELLDKVGPTFPKSLNMEKQGMFILGYYQQRQSFYTKNNKEEKGE